MIMKLRSIHYIFAFLTVVMSAVLSGCHDDFDFRVDGVSDEAASVSMAVDFSPASVGLTRAGYDGESIKTVEDLCFVLFNLSGEFIGIKEIDVTDNNLVKIEDIERGESASSDGKAPGETETKRLSFDIDLPIGSYYVYAVSNLRKYDNDGKVIMTTREFLDSKFPENAPLTRRGFCELRRSWDEHSIANNSELTGFVVNAESNGLSASPATDMHKGNDGYVLPGRPITVERGHNKLHCWLRRMASKVTVTFDASGLSDNISVFIHDVRIHDVVKSAPLLTPGIAEKDSIFNDNQYLAYCPEADMNKDKTQWKNLKDGWPKLTRNNWSFDQKDGTDDTASFDYLKHYTHSNSANALFFYENMQGDGESKLQDAGGDVVKDEDGNIIEDRPDGIIDSPNSGQVSDPDYKDKKRLGTYIEVQGYYVNRIRGEESEGPITYRFMLGKNTIDNYDCERNFHYKLTLCLKGRANEVDWHIEYEKEDDDVYIPNPYYISYGYNESLDLPIKARGKITSVKATIIRNDWYPSKMWEDVVAPEWKSVVDQKYDKYDYGNISETDVPKSTALGFLTLYQPNTDAVLRDKTAANERDEQYLLKYWCGEMDESRKNEDNSPIKLFSRTYTLSDMADNVSKEIPSIRDGKWSYVRAKKDNSQYTTVYVPLFTRERNLIKETGYSGQNPYDAYQRRAKVKYEISIEGKSEPVVKIIDVIQVVRLNNPKGIWRAWNNSKPFHVALNYLDGENSDTFITLESRGAWSAEVLVGADWILLNGGRQKIYGDSGSKVEFDYRPIGVLSSKDKYRCGIIEVRYHDYSCIHKIFVRQGYVPIQINNGDAYWYSMNMETKNSLCATPMDEGSMFRFGRWDSPIASINNYNDKTPWINVNPTDFLSRVNRKFIMADGSEPKSWADIGSDAIGSFMSVNEVNIGDNSNARMMTLEDIHKLRNVDNAYAFGVLYGDEATSTLFNINEAYGYKGTLSHQQYGMRGSFVYNKKTGAQIFFPIGSAGYGKLVHEVRGGAWGDVTHIFGRKVVLKYSNSSKKNEPNAGYYHMRPFYDLFKSFGAMYWLYEVADIITSTDAIDKLDSEALGLDLNYATYDFNPAPAPANLFPGVNKGQGANESDACFIRLVRDP